MALLCALSAILGAFFIIPAFPVGGAHTVSIGLNVLPVLLSGFFFGPVAGAITGAAADVIKWLLLPRGAYFPGYTVSMALMGATPALIMQLLNRKPVELLHSFKLEGSYTITKLFIAIGISQLLYSVGLNTYWTSLLRGVTMIVLLPARVITQAFTIPVYTLLTLVILRLPPIKNRN